MPHYDDYSDSDESDVDELQTSVLLGLPDGPIESTSNLSRLRISRLGGLPVFPNGVPRPPLSASTCDTCHKASELLVQLWCPFESSPYDRILDVWACSRASCQRKDGSVKAIRSLRFNAKYAAKLEAKRQKQAAKDAKPKTPTANPFSSTTTAGGAQLFGGGFGDDDPADEKDSNDSRDPSSASEGEEDDEEPEETKDAPADDVAELTTTLDRTTLDSSTSSSHPSVTIPSHPPLYLDTVFEYITPSTSDAATAKAAKKASQPEENQWGVEGYEKTEGLDEVFNRFVARVENEPQQCIRYDISGTPLPFTTDTVYKRLFPLEHTIAPSPGTKVIATGGNESSTHQSAAGKRTYDPSTIPPCDACGGPRTFECQLMPNLINVIRQARRSRSQSVQKKKQTDEERRAEVARLLRGESTADDEDGEGSGGEMEWGTCMIFSCVKDCCRRKDEVTGSWTDVEAAWKDEYVLVQWDV